MSFIQQQREESFCEFINGSKKLFLHRLSSELLCVQAAEEWTFVESISWINSKFTFQVLMNFFSSSSRSIILWRWSVAGERVDVNLLFVLWVVRRGVGFLSPSWMTFDFCCILKPICDKSNWKKCRLFVNS